MTGRHHRGVRPRVRHSCWRTAAVLCLVITPLLSCTLTPWGRRVRLELRLPPAPAEAPFFGGEGFELVLPKSGGDWRSLRVEPGTPVVEVILVKGALLPLRAYPLLEGRADLLRPAGGVYPATLDGRGGMELRYEDGFLAELLSPLIESEAIAGALNVERLRDELLDRSAGNPWRLDRRALLDGLAYGVMRSQRIRGLPTRSLELAVAPGRWITGNALDLRAQSVDPGGRLRLPELPVGIHHLYRIGGEAGERVDLEIGEEGWMMVDGATGSAESGRW